MSATPSSMAMEVNSLLGSSGVIRNYHRQPDLMGSASKSATDRTQYFHPSSEGGSYGNYGHQKGGKRSIALTALTLLSFLFFLHILQNCIQEQTDMMNPQVVIMQARLRAAEREAEANKRVGEEFAAMESKDKIMDVKGPNRESNEEVSLEESEKYQYPNKFTDRVVPMRNIYRES